MAAGKAEVISAKKPSGSLSVVYGTSILSCTHTKGGTSHGARALLWASHRRRRP